MPKKKFLNILNTRKDALPDGDPMLPIFEEEIAFTKTTAVEIAKKLPHDKRRIIKTHLPFELCPPDLLEKTKAKHWFS